MLCTPDHDNFYLTDEELQDTPSRRDGIDAETETSLRVFGAQLVQEATILLNCPQAVAATGQVLLQRFYCQRSFKQYNVKKLTAAVTFLAIKLEEVTHIPLRSVVMVFDRLWRRKENLPPRVMELGGNEYHQLKDSIIKLEREMLRVFGFIVHCDHPHKLLISLVRVLQGDDALMAEAWKIANDSLRTTLCVRFKSEVVACGVIFYAARRLQVPLLEGVQLVDGVSNWWEAFGVTSQQLVQVVQALHQLYQRPKAEYVQPGQQPRHVTPEAAGTPTRQAAATGATAAATDATSSGGKPAGPAAPGLSNSKLGSPAMEASSLRVKAGSGQSPASKPLANGGPKAAASEGGGDKRGDDEVASKREEASAAAIGSKRARSRSRSGSRSQSRDLRGGRDASRERRGGSRDSRRRSRSRSRDRAGRDRDRERERERERQRSDRGAGDRARDRRVDRGGDRPDSGRGEYRSSSHREPPPHSDHSRDRRRDYERDRDRDRDSSRQQPDSRSRDFRGERERGRARGPSEAAGRREYSSRREDRDRDGPPAPSRQDDDGNEPRARHSSAGGGGEPGGPRAARPASSHQSGRPAGSPARGPAPMAAVMEEDELENGSEGPRAGERGGGRWAKADGMSEGRRPNGAQESEGAAGLGEDEPMFASEDEDDRFPQDTGTPHDEE